MYQCASRYHVLVESEIDHWNCVQITRLLRDLATRQSPARGGSPRSGAWGTDFHSVGRSLMHSVETLLMTPLV